MEYIGTIFVALICFWLGVALGLIIKQKEWYKLGYAKGKWDTEQKEEQKDESSDNS